MANIPYAACQMNDADPEYLKIAKYFITQFYSMQDMLDRRDETKANLEVQKNNIKVYEAYHSVYREEAAKTFEGVEIFGRKDICEHMDKKISFKTIKYLVTTIDAQPGPPPFILVLVTGQLKTDEDRPLPFSNTFLLCYNELVKPDGTKQPEVTIQSEMFRLGVHNFAA